FSLIVWTTIQLAFKVQAYRITSNIENFENCVSIPTHDFSNGEYLNKEYLYYNCRLFLGAKTLAFYYDLSNKEIIQKRIIDLNYQSMGTVYPRMCVFGKINDRDKKIYGLCTVFISHTTFLYGYKELFFSTPPTPVTDVKTIENLQRKNILSNINDYIVNPQ
ncbi:hypothetical protein, partial [Psychrobacter sp. APC 3350]|uniref:hypothetical protein n=1 Tax=Psychrobacter sp. APC 3350 TaxID=3035195 RepID=UPI0025B5E5D5